ncbi:hypothetical protein VNO77_34459 [Canavalia gladiata]|uniref:Uncharacterized protein n=1 Tax=Canavalia gladiata TaxID=3824 RepID=A0AAN9KGR8_CANGL
MGLGGRRLKGFPYDVDSDSRPKKPRRDVEEELDNKVEEGRLARTDSGFLGVFLVLWRPRLRLQGPIGILGITLAALPLRSSEDPSHHGQWDRDVNRKRRQDPTLLFVIQHAPSPPFGFGTLEASLNKLVPLDVYAFVFVKNSGESFFYERRIASRLSAMRGSPYPYADPVELTLLFSLQFAWQDLITCHLVT